MAAWAFAAALELALLLRGLGTPTPRRQPTRDALYNWSASTWAVTSAGPRPARVDEHTRTALFGDLDPGQGFRQRGTGVFGGGQNGLQLQRAPTCSVSRARLPRWTTAAACSTEPSALEMIISVAQHWMATVTGRIGYAVTTICFYAKGGYAGVKQSFVSCGCGSAVRRLGPATQCTTAGQSRGLGIRLPRIGLSAFDMTIRLRSQALSARRRGCWRHTHLMRSHAIFSRPLSASTTSSVARGTQRIDGTKPQDKKPWRGRAFYFGKSALGYPIPKSPSTESSAVTKSEALDERNTATPAKSRSRPSCRGVRPKTLSCRPSDFLAGRLGQIGIDPARQHRVWAWMYRQPRRPRQERVNCTMPPLARGVSRRGSWRRRSHHRSDVMILQPPRLHAGRPPASKERAGEVGLGSRCPIPRCRARRSLANVMPAL